MARKLSQAVEDRLNVLMRSDKDVPIIAIVNSILQVLGDLRTPEERQAALAHVFAYRFFAWLSGSPTPADQYSPYPDIKPNGRDHAAVQVVSRDIVFRERIDRLELRMLAEQPTVDESATQALVFLEKQCPTVFHKITALAYMMGSPAFHDIQSCRDVRFNEYVDEDAYRAILWKHRGVLRRFVAIDCNRPQTKTGLGSAVLDAIHTIADERERAVVFGYALSILTRSDPITSRMIEVLEAFTSQSP